MKRSLADKSEAFQKIINDPNIAEKVGGWLRNNFMISSIKVVDVVLTTQSKNKMPTPNYMDARDRTTKRHSNVETHNVGSNTEVTGNTEYKPAHAPSEGRVIAVEYFEVVIVRGKLFRPASVVLGGVYSHGRSQLH